MTHTFLILSMLIAFFVAPVIGYTQSADTLKRQGLHEAYIARMNQYLSVKLSASNNIEGFVVESNDIKYDLRPNDKTVTKVSVNYRFISFGLSLTPKFIPGNNDNALKGNSKYTSYSIGFNFNHWVQDFSYTRSKGYYLKNTGDYIDGWVEGVDPYAQIPDLVYQSFHGQTAYKFNKKFSFNALSVQTERQLKSAGTFMPVLSYRYYIVDNRTVLTGQNSSQKSNNFETLLSAAYYYTFVVQKKMYISAGANAGAGIIFSKLLTRYPTENISGHYSNPIYTFEGSMAAGYNGERFFAGGRLTASAISYSRTDVSNVIINDRVTYQLFFGYRFGAPKILKDLLDEADEKRSNLFKTKK